MKRESGLRFRPVVEGLEAREVPASISYPDANGVITIVGSSGIDAVSVKYDATGTKVVVTASWGGSVTTSKAAVKSVVFFGLAGNDWFTNSTAVPTFAYGGPGNDHLTGGSGKDSLYGGSGNDVLSGASGNDKLYGESGTDTLYGGAGGDYLEGGSDFEVDTLWGGDGLDTFKVSPSYEDVLKDWFILEPKI
jgi:Ca2+-binding RTX toxin-like protein